MSTLWIAAREQMGRLHYWHAHRRKIMVACVLIALLIWLFATTSARA